MADVINHSTLPTSLLGYWDLQEASSTRTDVYGSNDLSDNATVTGATGKVGNASQFTASNSEYLSHTDNATFSQTGDMSFSFWMYGDTLPSTNGTNAGLIEKLLGTGNQRSYLFGMSYGVGTADTAEWRIAMSSDGSALTTKYITRTATSTSTWYHVVITYDASAGTVEIFVNGSSEGTATGLPTSIYDSTASFYLGASVNALASYFDGRLDEFGFWSKVLTSGEISDLYNSGSGIPFAEWTFEELFNSDTKTTGDLNGQDGWTANVLWDVSASYYYDGDQCLAGTNVNDYATCTAFTYPVTGGVMYVAGNKATQNRDTVFDLMGGGSLYCRLNFTGTDITVTRNGGSTTLLSSFTTSQWYVFEVTISSPSSFSVRLHNGTSWGTSTGSLTAINSVRIDQVRISTGSGSTPATGLCLWDTITPTDPTGGSASSSPSTSPSSSVSSSPSSSPSPSVSSSPSSSVSSSVSSSPSSSVSSSVSSSPSPSVSASPSSSPSSSPSGSTSPSSSPSPSVSASPSTSPSSSASSSVSSSPSSSVSASPSTSPSTSVSSSVSSSPSPSPSAQAWTPVTQSSAPTWVPINRQGY